MAVVCNLIRMGRWSELMVVCVCHSDEVMREAYANNTSGELGSAFPGSLVFRTAKLEMLTEPDSCLSYRLFRSARVNGEHCSLPALMNLCVSACGRVVVNNTHCRNCIIHSNADGQFF